MWEILLSGGLGHEWPIPNIWNKGEGKKEKEEEGEFIVKVRFNITLLKVEILLP